MVLTIISVSLEHLSTEEIVHESVLTFWEKGKVATKVLRNSELGQFTGRDISCSVLNNHKVHYLVLIGVHHRRGILLTPRLEGLRENGMIHYSTLKAKTDGVSVSKPLH